VISERDEGIRTIHLRAILVAIHRCVGVDGINRGGRGGRGGRDGCRRELFAFPQLNSS
jgi:hypothetical protein